MTIEGSIQIDDETILRPPRAEDARELFDLIDRNRHHLRWYFVAGDVVTVEDARAWLLGRLTQRIGGLVEKRSAIVGSVSAMIFEWPDQGKADLRYWLSEDAQGAGIVTKSCRALIDLAFDRHDVHRITIEAARENQRSRAVAERLGFTFEGNLRDAETLDDGYHDRAVYSLLSHERDRLPR